MNLRGILTSLFSFALGVVFVAPASPASSVSATDVPIVNQDSRQADREAIRAHIEKIFQSYLAKDCDAIRAAHARNWIGFTAFSPTILRGLDEYMKNSARTCVEQVPANPNAMVMVDYKISEIGFEFYGDVALVPYIADAVYGKSARIPGRLRSLDIYAKVNGAWIQVGSHLDLHPDTVSAQHSTPGELSPATRQALMSARETVWRAVFSNNNALLEKVIPQETIGINPATEQWVNRAAVFADAESFAKGGAKLVRLEFPKTEVQLFGEVAILYSTYLLELEIQGKTETQTGRATEIFVRRNGAWVNPGWHLDSGK